MLKRHRASALPALVLPLAFGLASLAAPVAEAAATRREPGASLLIPYFELDIDRPDGLTTLFSVGQASRESGSRILAHGVIWSDWGIPVYSWDFYLGPGDMVSYNVRDLISNGAFPATTPPAGVGTHCASPLLPTVGAEQLARLRRQLTGQADPASRLCSSEPRENASVATGSITIDVVRDCAHDGIDDPFDAGYFSGTPALADSKQVLVGDFFLVDPAADLAEGYDAISLGIGDVAGNTFWEGSERGDLRREPLSRHWRLRFLRGGPFAAETSFFVFHRRAIRPEPAACTTVAPGESLQAIWSFDVFDQAGTTVATDLRIPGQGRRTAARLDLDPYLPEGLLSGTVGFRVLQGLAPGPGLIDGQCLLFGAIEARGRFGAGIFGTPLE